MKIIMSALALSVFFFSPSLKAEGTLKAIYESTDSEENKILKAQRHLKYKMLNKHQLDGRLNKLGQQKWDLYLFTKFVKWGGVSVGNGYKFLDQNPNFADEIKAQYNSNTLNLSSLRQEYQLQTYSGFAMNVFYNLRCAHPKWTNALGNRLNFEFMTLSLEKLKNVFSHPDTQPYSIPQIIIKTIEDHLKDQSDCDSSGKKELIEFWRDWRKTSFAPPKVTASNLLWGCGVP